MTLFDCFLKKMLDNAKFLVLSSKMYAVCIIRAVEYEMAFSLYRII